MMIRHQEFPIDRDAFGVYLSAAVHTLYRLLRPAIISPMRVITPLKILHLLERRM